MEKDTSASDFFNRKRDDEKLSVICIAIVHLAFVSRAEERKAAVERFRLEQDCDSGQREQNHRVGTSVEYALGV